MPSFPVPPAREWFMVDEIPLSDVGGEGGKVNVKEVQT